MADHPPILICGAGDTHGHLDVRRAILQHVPPADREQVLAAWTRDGLPLKGLNPRAPGADPAVRKG